MPSRQIAPRIMSERRVGKKLWDVYFGGGNTPIGVFKPAGALLDLRPLFILPEVQGDRNWHGGLAFGFVDKEKKYVYAHGANVDPPVYVNRTSVSAAEFKDPKDLIDPKFKGKIVMQDPRGAGAGLADLYILYSGYGAEFLKKLFTEQRPVITRNYRQISEWLIRGRYPVAVGVSEANLSGFMAMGLGKDIERVLSPDVDAWNPISSTAVLFEGAPHPNAAKLYFNWLLSKETQRRLAIATGVNSRRVDVPPVNVKLFPDPRRLNKYIRNDEVGNKVRLEARDLARKLIK